MTALNNILRKHNFVIIKVDNLSVHGGSNRIYVRHIDSHDHEVIPINMQQDTSVSNNLILENDFGLNNFETYKIFADRVKK